MSGAYFTRVAAVGLVAALLGAAIFKPQSGVRYVEKAASFRPDPEMVSAKPCARGEAPLRGAFAPIDDVLSVSPLGGVTAPGETLPAPTIRVNTRRGDSVFERRTTDALAPSKAEVTAIERRATRNEDGAVASLRWTVHFSPCAGVSVFYDDLDEISPRLVEAAGGLAAFEELGGPDHLAIRTAVRVRAGEALGRADGFDVGLVDANAAPTQAARPERYASSAFERAGLFEASADLMRIIETDVSRARCPIDYMPTRVAATWSEKLGDAWGMRRAKGENACRTALADVPGTAQGAWFTDSSHNGATAKVSAVALAPDAVDPTRQVFALHGRLKSLNADMVALNPKLDDERDAATRDFLTFDAEEGRINPRFDQVKAGDIVCYEGLRANFVGPRINAIFFMQMIEEEAEDDTPGATLMKLEARGDATACADVEEEWAFTGAETTFYR